MRLTKTIITIGCIFPLAAMLPERTKASNLYLLPLGMALAAIFAIFSLHIDDAAGRAGVPIETTTAPRAVVANMLFVFPALAALALRERLVAGVGLIILSLAAAFSFWSPAAFASIALAAIAYAAAQSRPKETGRIFGVLFALMFFVAPVAALLSAPLLAHVDPASPLATLKTWGDIINADGFRLLTGHGFDFASVGVAQGYLPALTPRSALFETWFDLGLFGAAASAGLIYCGFRAATRQSPTLAPFWIAAMTYVLCASFLGLVAEQLWWLTFLTTAFVAFVVAGRGEYRVLRPSAPRIGD